ncbi:MAG: hypothetical protein OEW75_07130, partial [Cyclobacteriaceae bacterium]|nr:hypothetical protein [Cyclobacteriaceae bacterium]
FCFILFHESESGWVAVLTDSQIASCNSQLAIFRGELLNQHLYQGKEYRTEDGLNLYDFHARQYDPALGRFLAVDPAGQFSNPYLGMGNNPVVGVDPDGKIVWMPVIIAAAVFGSANLGIQMANGDVENFADGVKAFAAGAVTGAALAVGGQLAAGVAGGVPGLKQALWGINKLRQVNNAITAVNGVVGLTKGIASGDWSHLEQTFKVFAGNYYLDPNRNFFGQTLQGISRHSREMLQTEGGYGYSQLRILGGNVDRVDYFGGATFLTSENLSYSMGVSIGNYINVWTHDQITGDFKQRVITDPLYMHEYGHIYDSQLFGVFYLPGIGIPSVSGAEWTEFRANRWVALYFEDADKGYGVNWSNYETGSWDLTGVFFNRFLDYYR